MVVHFEMERILIEEDENSVLRSEAGKDEFKQKINIMGDYLAFFIQILSIEIHSLKITMLVYLNIYFEKVNQINSVNIPQESKSITLIKYANHSFGILLHLFWIISMTFPICSYSSAICF
jgi:hypothetical protein